MEVVEEDGTITIKTIKDTTITMERKLVPEEAVHVILFLAEGLADVMQIPTVELLESLLKGYEKSTKELKNISFKNPGVLS